MMMMGGTKTIGFVGNQVMKIEISWLVEVLVDPVLMLFR